jgi:diguanylate cyclase (GGDEF)-like protein
MQIDLPTISAVHVTITALLGVVLLLIWVRGRESPLIGWWGLALLIQAVGLAMTAVLFFANVPLAIAGAIMILGDAIKWKAAREFIHRPAHVFWILLGPVAFLLAVQSGLLHSFDHRLDALSTTLALYNFATAYQFSQAKGEQPASRWPVVVLLVILGCFQMLWFPLNIAMPINEARWVAASIWFPTVMLLTLLLRVAIAFVVLSLAKERSNIERRNEALTDALTGLPNRRALFEAADAFGQDRDRTGGAISVLIFDLDHFKRTNDRFGHELGDRVLKLFATTVRTHFEGPSIVARLGGEEFAAILPNVDRLGAVETGEAVRHAFAKSGAFVDGLPVGATVSVGSGMGCRRRRRPQRAVPPRRRGALRRQARRAQPRRVTGTGYRGPVARAPGQGQSGEAQILRRA